MTGPLVSGCRPEHSPVMALDPVVTNPDHYTVVFENDRVRVLEYTDRPGSARLRTPTPTP